MSPFRFRVQWTGSEDPSNKEVIPVENVKFEVVEGNRLLIHVDLNYRGDISASGKTRRVASTLGNIGFKDANGVEIKIGLNVYVKPDV